MSNREQAVDLTGMVVVYEVNEVAMGMGEMEVIEEKDQHCTSRERDMARRASGQATRRGRWDIERLTDTQRRP